MKTVILTTIVLASFSAFAGSTGSVCGQPERDSYELAIERYQVGEMTKTDVEQAHLDSIQADYDCKLILKDRYCYESLQAAQAVLDGTKEEERVGQKTMQDVFNAQKQLAKYQRTCAPGVAQ